MLCHRWTKNGPIYSNLTKCRKLQIQTINSKILLFTGTFNSNINNHFVLIVFVLTFCFSTSVEREIRNELHCEEAKAFDVTQTVAPSLVRLHLCAQDSQNVSHAFFL